jgi:(1->4)-alpha-D-glucan 1-alpha-D-glucosylmutase
MTESPGPVAATYRIQLHAGFTFDDAAAVAAYLRDLGISHVYCSPYLQATRGSTHGYDVIDYSVPNQELGGEAGLARFVAELRAQAVGQVLDIVPNHMAISTSENQWWADVLANGPSSHFASYFDVEWESPEARLRNLVLIPVLADHYGRELEAGALVLERRGAAFMVRYGEHAYPINPSSLGPVIGPAARLAGSDELGFLADAFGNLPRPTATDRASVRRRHRDATVLQDQLQRLVAGHPAIAEALDQTVATMNADPDALHALLELQNYRLAWWRSAATDLGYRRFFDINTLIGLRVEDELVFGDTHRRVIQWVHEGHVDGLRIDHLDGLREPQRYLERLRAEAPDVWIVVEKVLGPDESLPRTWPVAGTTGYDFLNRVLGLFVNPAGEAVLTDFYRSFTGEERDYATLVHDKKSYVLREVLGSDVSRLAELLLQICERHRRYRDYSRHQLTEAVRELAACLSVYRTYVDGTTGTVSEADRLYMDSARSDARKARPDIEEELLGFLSDLLLLEITGPLEGEFVARFQQLTGPAMAKGVEDTVFYVYNRFIALNEVGGDPSRFGVAVDDFHQSCEAAQDHWPLSMVATATHDTKRGEDVRTRLAVLSERPETWIAAVQRWSRMTAAHRTGAWPDRNTEYLFYQTLVGAWPLTVDRLTTYIQKAAREAKVHTSWTSPQGEYEMALKCFVEGCLSDAPFMADVEQFVGVVLDAGRVNSLAQTLLKMTAPGVPDLYQGTELWSLHLVDPDNRAPVDYAARRRLLEELDSLDPASIMKRSDEGLPKLWVVHRALQVRRTWPAAFGPAGPYAPVRATGVSADHVVAFSRGDDVLTVVPRLTCGPVDWARTTISLGEGAWRNVLTRTSLTADVVDLATLWSDFPVALLERHTK